MGDYQKKRNIFDISYHYLYNFDKNPATLGIFCKIFYSFLYLHL